MLNNMEDSRCISSIDVTADNFMFVCLFVCFQLAVANNNILSIQAQNERLSLENTGLKRDAQRKLDVSSVGSNCFIQ